MLNQGRASVIVLAYPKLPGDSAEQQNSAKISRLEAKGAFLKVSGYCISQRAPLRCATSHTHIDALNIHHYPAVLAKHTNR